MTVRRGVDWGEPGPLAADAPVVSTDAQLADAVRRYLAGRSALPASAQARGGLPCEAGLMGGDLHRTLGSPRHTIGELHEGRGMRFPVDVCTVEVLDGTGPDLDPIFCAHLIATQGRGVLFARHTLVAMNAAFRGSDYLAPRAHPGDGLIDTIEGSLGFPDRLRAHRRFVTGTHVPHPSLATRRVAEADFEFAAPASLVLDGRYTLRAKRFRIRCLPDAFTVVV